MSGPESDRQGPDAASEPAGVTGEPGAPADGPAGPAVAPGAIPEAPAGGPRGARPSGRRLALGAAVIVAAVAIGGGVVYATSKASTTDSAGTRGGFAGQRNALPGNASMVTDALHGEFVVSDGNGGYRTVLTQTGTVTRVSATALTVRSSDAHTDSYTVNATTTIDAGAVRIGSVRVGHVVTVLAAKTGMLATTITDTTLTGSAAKGGNPAGKANPSAGADTGRNGRPGADRPSGAPAGPPGKN